MEELVGQATEVLEGVADESWVGWAGRLIPGVARQVREAGEAKKREEEAKRFREEKERVARENAERVVRRERRVREKVEAFIEGQITEEELERNSEAEADIEVAVGSEVEETGGPESSAMEVDDGGESEVVAVEEETKRGGRKRAPSSPPKASRKRARAATATQSQAGSQSKAGGVEHTGTRCERCVRQGIVCVAVDGGARCANCKAKHYKCSLVAGKEGMGGKGGPAGSQQAKVAAGSQMRRKASRGKGAKGSALGGLSLGEWPSLPPSRVLT